jgi:hypothetical protein
VNNLNSGIINHGLFEILQGNNSTNGFFIEAIGDANRFWVHGTEAAFTILRITKPTALVKA